MSNTQKSIFPLVAHRSSLVARRALPAACALPLLSCSSSPLPSPPLPPLLLLFPPLVEPLLGQLCPFLPLNLLLCFLHCRLQSISFEKGLKYLGSNVATGLGEGLNIIRSDPEISVSTVLLFVTLSCEESDLLRWVKRIVKEVGIIREIYGCCWGRGGGGLCGSLREARRI